MTPIDSHHKPATQFTQQGDVSPRAGRLRETVALYRAALAEKEVALNLLKAAQAGAQTLFVFHKSEISLAFKSAAWPRAQELIEEGIRLQLQAAMLEELEALLDRIPKKPGRPPKISLHSPKDRQAVQPVVPTNENSDKLLKDVEIQGTFRHF
jgi:hypothetical protein